MAAERAELAEVLTARSAAAERDGDAATAAHWSRLRCELDPLNETAHADQATCSEIKRGRGPGQLTAGQPRGTETAARTLHPCLEGWITLTALALAAWRLRMGTLVIPAFTTGTPLLIWRVNALHVADLASSPVLPADSLAQGPAETGQTGRRTWPAPRSARAPAPASGGRPRGRVAWTPLPGWVAGESMS